MEKKKNFKILAAGDLHGDTLAIKKLAKQAKKEDVNLVLLTGDLVDFDEDNLKGFIGPFRKAGKKVMMVHGNHESKSTIDLLSRMYSGTYSLHGYYLRYGDIGIVGIGGAEWNELLIDPKGVKKAVNKGFKYIYNAKKKVLLVHAFPEGTELDDLGFMMHNPGTKLLNEIIKKHKPDFCFCGHIHEFAGLESKIGNTKVINPGKQGFVVDLLNN